MTLDGSLSREERSRWKIVRLDFFTDLDVEEILAASDETGEICVQIKGEVKTMCFGSNGIRICRR